MATLTPPSIITSISSVVQSTSTVIYVRFYAGDANGDVATVTFKATQSGQSIAAWSETIAVANLTEISTQQYSAGLDVTSMVQSLSLGTNYSLTLAWSDGNDTSEYVNAGSFAIYDPPVITITSPGATVSGLPLSLVWSITDTTGVASQGVFIHPQGTTIASRIYYWGYDTDTRALSVPASEVSLTNGATYTVTVHVVNGVGIQRSATADFTVAWSSPITPTATIVNDSTTLSSTITVFGDRTLAVSSDSPTLSESGTIIGLTVDGLSEQDGTPTPSAPVPIESIDDPVLVYVRGFNQWDEEWANGYFGNDGNWITSSGVVASKYPISVKPNTTYYLKNGYGAPTYVTMWEDAYISGSPAPVHPISRENYSNATFTTPPNCRYIHFNCGSAYGGTYRNDICINVSCSRNGEYVPYDGSTTTIDLQGYELRSLPDGTHDTLTIDEDGAVTLTKRVGAATLDGTEGITWTIGGSSSLRIIFTSKSTWQTKFGELIANATASTRGNVICNRLPANNAAYNTWTSAAIQNWTDSSAAIMFGIEQNFSSSAEFNTWLQSNPLEVLYPLATEQTISLGTVTLPWVSGGTMTVEPMEPTFSATVQAAEFAGQPAVTSLMVTRTDADGNVWVVGDSLNSGDTVTDPLPPLNTAYTYTITASAVSGATSTKTVTQTFDTEYWAMNFGSQAQECVTAAFNVKASHTMSHGGSAYHFADGGAGGGLPVWYSTTDRDESGSFNWDTVGQTDADRLNSLSLQYPVGWLRDPYGHRWRAHMVPSVNYGMSKVWQMSIKWDAVRFQEAW